MSARTGTVLVVDDDTMNQTLLSALLEEEGYRPLAVSSGEAALEAAAGQSFDAVLLDIVMPGIDGIEVLRSLKGDSRWWHIPVIMISAVEETDSIVRCIELGAEDYLLKPFDPVLLRARVNACLARRRFTDLESEYHAIIDEQQAELEELRRRAGSGLSAATPTGSERGRLEPQRSRVATATFALLGLSELDRAANPEETLRVVHEFHTVVAAGAVEAAAIAAASGSVTLIFPAPGGDAIREVHHRAVAIEADLAPALASWGKEHGVALGLGVGFAVGDASLGSVGAGPSSAVAVGAVVDRAAALAASAGIHLDDDARSIVG